MIKNYLKIAFRVFKKDKAYSLLNIMGLTVGITASLLLFAYSYNESLYDQYHENKDRIIRVVMDVNFGDDARSVAVVPAALGNYIKEHAPSVEEYAMLRPIPYSGFQVVRGDEVVAESGLYYASQGVLDMFTFDWLAGDRATALLPHNTIVLTRSLAEKYFGEVDKAVGGVITRDDGTQYKVTGVIEDVTHKGHFTPRAFVSLWDDSKPTNWRDWNWSTYLLLSGGGEDFAPVFQQAFEENMAAELEQQGGGKITFSTQKLTDIYYDSRLEFEMEPNEGNRAFIQGFTIVGVFLLLLAIINYINLVTAQSQKRAREVGVKKAFGISSSSLRMQFFTEAFAYVLLAALLSAVALVFMNPVFQHFTGDKLPTELLASWKAPVLVVFFILMVSFLSGAYPAILISSFRPVQVLKANGVSKSGGGLALRKALIVLQLSVSLLMIVGITGVYTQLRYISDYSLGFEREQVLLFNLPNAAVGNYHPLKERLMTYTQIDGVASMTDALGEKPPVNDFTYEIDEGERTEIIQQLWVDEGFFETIKVALLAGTNFRYRPESDTTHSGVLVNRAFVEHAGWQVADVPGKQLWSHDWGDKIIGVVEDFHVVSLHDKLEPLVFRYNMPSRNMLVRYNGSFSEAMDIIQETSREVAGEALPSWTFLGQKFQRQYEEDEKRASLLVVFTGIVIFIACLGLLGVTAYEVRRRNKEIGIRKILGANASGILLLFSRSYIALIAWAALLSIPVANYLLTEWLGSFAYRIEVGWWMLVLPLVILAGICAAVISIQSVKATRVNPVECLRHE
jgi:putative ABC transport system permease protein